MASMARISEEELKMTMDFYEDIDVDFGDKSYDFAELLKIAEGDFNETKNDGNSRRNQTEVVWEDELDDEEDERDPQYYQQMNADITQDVVEVIGNTLLNEPLENKYKEQNPPDGRKSIKSASKSKKASGAKIGAGKILKKSDLRKEMAGESAVVFTEKKRQNALLNALANKPSTNNEAGTEADEDKTPEPEMDPIKRERILKWVMEQSSEEDYHSARSSFSSNYLSASTSASDNDTPKKYRATSQRSRKKTTPTTDESVSPKFSESSSMSSKSPPATATSSDEVVQFRNAPATTTSRSIPSPPKTATKRTTIKRREIYIPGDYNKKFEIDSKQDFPPLCLRTV